MNMDKNKKFDMVTVGSDPEFVVMVNGVMRSALTFFSKLFGHDTGLSEGDECENCGESGGGNCDDCGSNSDLSHNMGADVGDAGNIGWDGHDETGEMRPTQSESPFGHAANIATLLKYVYNKNRLVKLAAVNGSRDNRPVSTGGHIHFGIDNDTNVPGGWSRISSETAKGPILDLMSALMLPIVFADGDKDYATRRINGSSSVDDSSFSFNSYGKLSDWRVQNRDGVTVFEFRALTSSWLSTEALASVTLATSGAIFEGLLMLSGGEFTELCKKLKPYTTNIQSLQRLALMDRDGVLFAGISNRLRKEIRLLPTYKKWGKEIDLALNGKWQAKQVARGGKDIFAGWDLKSSTRIPLYAVQREFILPENEINECMEAYAMSYGTDHNVRNYALEFAKASKALGWQLKKTVHLYGIKMGANAYIVMNANGEGHVVRQGAGEVTSTHLETAQMKALNLVGGSARALVGDKRNAIAIGIPYEARQANNLKGILELIWRVDNDALELSGSADWHKLKNAPKPEPIITDSTANTTDATTVCAAS